MTTMSYAPLATELREVTWNGHILSRNCLIEHVTEGKTE